MAGWLRRTAEAVREKLGAAGRRAELLARYKPLRRAGVALNSRLVKTLSRSVLDEGGKKLGILKGNVLTLDSDDELSVLMDYCIFDVRRRGLNAVERYLQKSPPAPDSDDDALLQAMRQARYSLFAAEALEPGLGVHVRDLLADEALFLVDLGFSRTATVGMILAARVMAPEGVTITTGAALPVGILSAEECACSCNSWGPLRARIPAPFRRRRRAKGPAGSSAPVCDRGRRGASATWNRRPCRAAAP